MFKSLNRGLAAAVHMARPNQWRAMASMAKQKEDEMKNWTRDKVSSYAQSVISSEVFIHAFKAEELDGESLLDLPQNQTLMDALVSAGGKRAHVNKLAKSVRERVAPGGSPRHPLLPAVHCVSLYTDCLFHFATTLICHAPSDKRALTSLFSTLFSTLTKK